MSSHHRTRRCPRAETGPSSLPLPLAVALTAALALIVASPTRAPAQTLDQPYSRGFALNPIEPAPAGDRFFTVPGGFSDPDAPEHSVPVRGMLFGHFAWAPALTRTDNATGSEADIVASQLYLHASLTGYVLPWLMLHADLPFAAVQTGEGDAAPGTALGDLRAGARFGLLGTRNDPFGLSPGVDVWLPTGSPDNLSGDQGLRAEPYLSIGGKASILVYAAKVGVQFRRRVNAGSLEVGHSLTYGISAGVSLFRDLLQVGPELTGRSLLSSENGDAFSNRTSPMTALFGAKGQLSVITLGAGVGVGLTEAPGTAPRAFFSIAYNPITRSKKKERAARPVEPATPSQQSDEFEPEPPAPEAHHPPADVDSDGDDILDSVDACPDLMGEPSDSMDRHGCPPPVVPEPAPTPEPAPAPVRVPRSPDSDRDGDGIIDTLDSCPQEPGVGQPDNDARNGCPIDEPEQGSSTNGSAPEGVTAAATTGVGSTSGSAGAGRSGRTTPEGPPTATWVGFRETGAQSALIYVELTQAVPVTSSESPERLVFTLSGTRVKIRNNRNPLLATHFASVVKSARLEPRGSDLQLIIQLDKPASASARIVQQEDGAVLRVELQQRAATQDGPEE